MEVQEKIHHKWKISSSSNVQTGIKATNNNKTVTWSPPSATQSGTSPALKTLQLLDHPFSWTILPHQTKCRVYTVARTPNGVIFFAKI